MLISDDDGTHLFIENPEDTLTVLKMGRQLIEDPENWTKGTLARDRYGSNVGTTDTKATQWCAVGALQAHRLDYPEAISPAHSMLMSALPKSRRRSSYIQGFNDNPQTTHRQVMNMFDRAIKKLMRGK